MRLLEIKSRKWKIHAVSDEKDRCPLMDFLSNASKEHQGSVAGILTLFDEIANGDNGPRNLSKNISHYVDQNDRIFQFTKGSLRVLWFYGEDNKVIICSHGFIKSSKKTKTKDKNKAKTVKATYLAAHKQGTIEVVKRKTKGK